MDYKGVAFGREFLPSVIVNRSFGTEGQQKQKRQNRDPTHFTQRKRIWIYGGKREKKKKNMLGLWRLRFEMYTKRKGVCLCVLELEQKA